MNTRIVGFAAALPLLMATADFSFAQRAENLNLNNIVQAPYNAYGRLADGVPNAEKLGWKVGVQFYTFNKYTFFEAVDLTRALGLHYIELSMGAKLSPDFPERINPKMSEEAKAMLRKKLNDSGVRCESVYCGMNGTGEGFEDTVKFCKEMGWMIVTDPKRADQGGQPVSFYEDILKKYGVRMVFTNHPKDAAYWNPDFIVEDTKGYSELIGASLDLGHQMRGGFDTYEVAKKYIDIDKMYHFHLRDVSEIGPHGLDVPCFTGAGRLPEIFRALSDKDIRPLIAIEYEHDFDNPLPYLIKSVENINAECGKILAERAEKARLGAPVNLYASDAILAGDGIHIEGKGQDATIHGWNSAAQTISWKANLKPGNYQVLLRYTEPYMGSAATLEADGQELASLFIPSFTWYDFRTEELGVLKITNGGDVTLTFRGIQNSYKRNRQGRLRADEALPDVHYLTLVPTSLPETSQPVDIYKQFNGHSIFDGKTFNGWEGNDGENSMALFRIEKKCIVGGTMTKELAHNQFLRTDRYYDNFEIHLKYKVKSTDKTYNGGIQFRSVHQSAPGLEYEMVGYQADILDGQVGPLYDEQRRWSFLGMTLDVPEKYNQEEWNDYVIRCEGPRIRIWINGVKTRDFIEPFVDDPFEGMGMMAQDGYIALQIHEGPACEMWYKDIMIEEL